VFYHDVQHAVPLLMSTLFYVTPVFYSLTLVPESVRPIFMINPLAWLLTLYHSAVYYGELPTAGELLVTTGVAAVLLVLGYGVFNRYARFLAEVV
jgi:ABC-type polysaccharide/polyol phosphate export permease